jgi:Mn2+/Fe2+ NRAMP family transporter
MNPVVKLFRSILGPAAVMAAGSMGAGAVASLVLAGAWFRYDLLWVVLLVLPVFVISVDSASRIGFLNRDQGMLSLVRRYVHPSIAWLILAINVPVHILIIMGQMSVMTSSLGAVPGLAAAADSQWGQVLLSFLCAVLVLWLVLSRGYDRMQKVMTGMMLVMFLCFLVVALRAFTEAGAIIAGFVPGIPDDLAVPGEGRRIASSSMIAIIGTAIAPAALLGMPYLTGNALREGGDDTMRQLKANLRQSVINLGLIYGFYSALVLIAGGFALYSLPNNATIDSVTEAGKVFGGAFPPGMAFIGPIVFSIGVFIAAMTTLVIAAQVLCYFCLDMFGKDWRFTSGNRLFHYLLILFVLVPALLAPFWEFPALLKVVLLMGINVVVIPLVMGVVIYLSNRDEVVGKFRAEWWRNGVLVAGLLISLFLAVVKTPDLLGLLLN